MGQQPRRRGEVRVIGPRVFALCAPCVLPARLAWLALPALCALCVLPARLAQPSSVEPTSHLPTPLVVTAVAITAASETSGT